jgi:hypothetical protein
MGTRSMTIVGTHDAANNQRLVSISAENKSIGLGHGETCALNSPG